MVLLQAYIPPVMGTLFLFFFLLCPETTELVARGGRPGATGIFYMCLIKNTNWTFYPLISRRARWL